MSVLVRQEIVSQISQGKLIRNARRKSKTEYDVEVASYDLMAGEAIWKDAEKRYRCSFNPNKPFHKQETATLKPGQMMFVVTAEDVVLPTHISATVYSRNSLSRSGILALNTGHIDPGFEGPIIIRLINLRSIDYTLKLGDPIFTIVFQCVNAEGMKLDGHHKITRDETINRALRQADEALSNALYDLALLREFVKKDEFGDSLWKWVTKSFKGILTLVAATIAFIAAVLKIYEFIKPYVVTTGNG
jgi:deoxycytidine triphosphate deaminase